MAQGQWGLALLVFIGGLAAATGMVIVATITLSTMVCNDLIMPALLNIKRLRLDAVDDLTGLLLGIRRGAIVAILLLGYLYYRLIGESYALVSIGLVSFVAAAQFAPSILLGLYWRQATRLGATIGLAAGFLTWCYTLLLPALARSGWLSDSYIEHGPAGIALLKPYELFGLTGLDIISHAVFWSLLLNTGLLVVVSLFSRPSALETIQADQFVRALDTDRPGRELSIWRGTATVGELRRLAERFMGVERTNSALAGFSAERKTPLADTDRAHPLLVAHIERLLAGAVGAASAKAVVSSAVQGEALSVDALMSILDETSQVIEYSHRLEEKSAELEAATRELTAANARLKELDRLKDEFVSTVSHELRTPLTSIRAFLEILHDDPELPVEDRQRFLKTVVGESERLTRLINDVLDLSRIEAGRMHWDMQDIDLVDVVNSATAAVTQLFAERDIALDTRLEEPALPLHADADRLVQVVINLLSNAGKFCESGTGRVIIDAARNDDIVTVTVTDNGPGIAPDELAHIFDRFHQISDAQRGKPAGSGLGLAICQRIVEHHGGTMQATSTLGQGASFRFDLPAGHRGADQ